jgi:CRISPR system Cascade subunit CasD
VSAAEFLIFQLYGAMASWGETAVGEVRPTASWPSRSALAGLIGAALGIERDAPEQESLCTDYRFAVKVLSEGTALRDYHTVQTSNAGRGRVHRNRLQQLLVGEDVSTMLSYRDYRCDARAIVAIEALPSARWPLQAIAGALKEPRFTLYLGRKSCPPALPLKPEVVCETTLEAALDNYPADWLSTIRRVDRRQEGAPIAYVWDVGMPTALTATFTQERIDQPLSRRRWQFGPRLEAVHLHGRA